MNPFRVDIYFLFAYPGFALRSNPGLGLSNAFGVMTTAKLATGLFQTEPPSVLRSASDELNGRIKGRHGSGQRRTLEVPTVDLYLWSERDHDAHRVRPAVEGGGDEGRVPAQGGFKFIEHSFVPGRLDHVCQ